MGKMRVMSRMGDKQVSWDSERVEMGDLDALAAIKEAERIFKEEKAKGGTAFRIRPGEPAERIDYFDKTADQIVFVPRVAGG
ncbi:MAG: hypothetical protein M1319_07000 [Chloroflexi bacterium]|nr:hypothetical protein [Chloroflexota bacterium]